MGKQEALYLLIKSLQPGEKSLVRQANKGDSGYMALFDAMSRQREYNEGKIKKRLAQQGVKINFSFAKNYLTKHILSVLRESHSTPATTLDRLLLDIDILLERKIYSHADPLISKALERAWNEERFDEYLQISGYAIQRILRTGEKIDDNIAEINALNARRAEARRHLLQLGELEDLFFTYQPISKRKRNARNTIDLNLIRQFSEHPLLQPEARPTSVRGQRMYLRCLTHIQAFMGDFEGSRQRREEFLHLFREHDFLLGDHPVEYLNELVALGSLQLFFGENEACLATLATIREFQSERQLHGSELFDKYYRLLLGYAMGTGDHVQVVAEIDTIKEGLKLYSDSLPWTTLSMIYFLLARIFFDQENFSDSRHWLDQILGHTTRGIREDITSLARILTIFTHLEEGDFELVEAQSRATRKYLRRRDQLHRFESRILSYLEHNSFHVTNAEEKSTLETLRSELSEIFEDPQEAPVLRYFDMLGWLERRINSL